MTPEEVKEIAKSLVDEIHSSGHEFWIDPEAHYQDHQAFRQLTPDEIHSVKDMVQIFNMSKGFFLKAFLGFAIVGAIIAALFGIGFKFK